MVGGGWICKQTMVRTCCKLFSCRRRRPPSYSRQHVWNFLEETCSGTSRRQRKQWFAVFDVLLSAHCHWRICVASVVSVAYDVHASEMIDTSLKQMLDWREQVARTFGKSTERFCYLLHALSQLGMGERQAHLVKKLDAHCGPNIEGVRQDICDMQIVEAARLLALGQDLESFPALAAAWREQQEFGMICSALDVKSSLSKKLGSLRWRLQRFLPWPRSKFGIRLRCFGKDRFVELPVNPRNLHSECVAKWSSLGQKQSTAMSGFIVTGQDSFGMPGTPFHMLNKFWERRCAGFDFEWNSLVPLNVTAVPLSGLPQPRRLDAVSVSALSTGCPSARAQLCRTLEVQGWAAISVSPSAISATSAAYEALQEVCKTLAPQEKDATHLKFDGSRFVGLAQDRGREWMQLRPGVEDPLKFPWPEKAEKYRATFAAAYRETEFVACSAFEGLASHLGLQIADCKRLVTDAENSFGPSVMRIFLYRDPPREKEAREKTNASEYHADMGLVTVSPPSTIPALELFNPMTGTMTKPEDLLRPGEWLVFAGETLAFLSGGKLLAPLHRVPWVDRCDGKPRYSSPFFLRAAPEAELHPLGNRHSMTCRCFMERYNGLRPWRVQGAGDW